MSNLPTSEHLHPYLTDIGYSTNLISPAYTSITDVIEDTPPGETVGESEDTQLQSPGAAKEYGPGWVTNGDFEFTVYYVGPQERTLAGFAGGRTKLAWRITAPMLSTQSTNGDRDTFIGFIKERKPQKGGADSDDRLKVQYTIKVSGPITHLAGA